MFWGKKVVLRLYICATLFADIVCHTKYRYTVYQSISALVCCCRCPYSLFTECLEIFTFNDFHCWNLEKLALILNKGRKHIPALLVDSHWCHFLQRQYCNIPRQTKLGMKQAKHSESCRATYIVTLLLFAEKYCAKRTTSMTTLP